MKLTKNRFRLTSPASDRYVPAADGLRALCTLGIMWYHIWQQSWLQPCITVFGRMIDFNWLVRCGYLLVDGMLALSGFLLFLPYARSALDASPFPAHGEFYRKRAARILPGYLLSVLVMLFFVAIPEKQYATTGDLLKDLFAHLTLTSVFFPISYTYTHLNVVLWTVSVEAQFYIFFPLIARAFAKKPLITYSAMIAVSFAYRHFASMQPDTTHLINQLPAMLDVYANGMLACYAYVTLARSLKENTATGLVFTIGAAVCLYFVYILFNGQLREDGYPALRLGQMARRYGLSLSFSLFILCASNALNPVKWFFGNRLMRFLSTVSYQMYIWHHPLALQLKVWRFPAYVSEANPQFYNEPIWQKRYTLVCFVLSLIVGTVLTYGFEKPVARLILKPQKKKEGRYNASSGHSDS